MSYTTFGHFIFTSNKAKNRVVLTTSTCFRPFVWCPQNTCTKFFIIDLQYTSSHSSKECWIARSIIGVTTKKKCVYLPSKLWYGRARISTCVNCMSVHVRTIWTAPKTAKLRGPSLHLILIKSFQSDSLAIFWGAFWSSKTQPKHRREVLLQTEFLVSSLYWHLLPLALTTKFHFVNMSTSKDVL